MTNSTLTNRERGALQRAQNRWCTRRQLGLHHASTGKLLELGLLQTQYSHSSGRRYIAAASQTPKAATCTH